MRVSSLFLLSNLLKLSSIIEITKQLVNEIKQKITTKKPTYAIVFAYLDNVSIGQNKSSNKLFSESNDHPPTL